MTEPTAASESETTADATIERADATAGATADATAEDASTPEDRTAAEDGDDANANANANDDDAATATATATATRDDEDAEYANGLEESTASWDDAEDETPPKPPPPPDIFDRLYPSDADDDEDADDAAPADAERDGEVLAPLLDAIRDVDAGTTPLDPNALGSLAFALAGELNGYLATRDDLPGAPLSDMPEFLVETVDHLGVLARALTFAPNDVVTQRGGATVPASGTHRVAVLEIFATLLEMGTKDVDEAVAACSVVAVAASRAGEGEGEGEKEKEKEKEGGGNEGEGEGEGEGARVGVVAAAAAMLFTHAQGTPALRAIARLLCAALASDAESLWTPLLTRGWGSAAAEVGVTPRDREDETEDAALQTRLAAAAKVAAKVKPGKRAPNVGVALAVAEKLRELEGDEDPPHLTLRETLQADAEWQACAGEGGALDVLDVEQNGTLCGPKPNRVMPGDFGGGAGGMSGKDLLLMLQSLGRSAGAVPAHERGRE